MAEWLMAELRRFMLQVHFLRISLVDSVLSSTLCFISELLSSRFFPEGMEAQVLSKWVQKAKIPVNFFLKTNE